MYDNVIVGVDDAEAGRDALALARQLASPHAQFTLAYVQVVMPKPDPDSGAWSLTVERRPAVARLLSLRDESHLDARTLAVEARSVAAGLHELAARRGADLLVISGSRRDDYERELVRDDTHAVLEKAPCPVAVAPLGYARRAAALDDIGVAYDGSPDSDRALALARELAHARGGRLSAFEPVKEPLYLRDPWNPQPEIDERVAQVRTRIAGLGALEAFAEAADDAAEALVRYGASVDLLVFGGSHTNAQRVAADAPCPLLVLMPTS